MSKRLIAMIAVTGILLVAVLYVLMQDPSGVGDEPDKIITSQTDPTEPGVGNDIITRGSGPGGTHTPEETLAMYRKWAQYPPSSRPLHAGQRDLLEPFNAARPASFTVKVPAKDCEDTPKGRVCKTKAVLGDAKCKMTPARTISVGKKEMAVEVYCYRGSDPKKTKLALEGFKAKVYTKLFRKIRPSLPPISQGDNGSGGDKVADDKIYTFVVRPGSRDWGPMFLEVDFQVDGHRHVQRVDWFSTPHIVADFKPGISDRLDNGHLVVSVPVRVFKAGYYKIDANLQEQGGDKRMVASATFQGKLEAGAQTVDIKFWGKVIRDLGASGPFIVRNIRGRRDNSTVTPDALRRSLETGTPLEPKKQTEPLHEFMEPFGKTHETRSYSTSEFSKKEWQSPLKEKRINYLKGLIK